jgi:hypothetical protein
MGQLPPVHLKPHSAPKAHVHWAPTHSPVQVLPAAQYTGQLPEAHSRSQVQPGAQVQIPPFWQVSVQQLLAPQPAQVVLHEPPKPPMPVEAELLAAVVPAPPMPVVVVAVVAAPAPPAVDVVGGAPPAPDEAESDDDPPADEALALVLRRPSSGSVQLDAASSASKSEAATSAKARATRGRDIAAR